MRTPYLLAACLGLASANAFASEATTTPATTNTAPSAPATKMGEMKTGNGEGMKDMNHDTMAHDPAAPMGKEMFTAEMVLNKIHAINLEEIEGAKLAKSNGDKKVHGYAERMMKDHSKADKDLMTLAEKKNITVHDPATVPNLPQAEKDKMAQDKAMMDQMKSQKGAEFDHGYLAMMSKGHAEALEFLQQAATNVQDKDVKSFVGKITPVVKDHKKMADALMKDTKVQGRR